MGFIGLGLIGTAERGRPEARGNRGPWPRAMLGERRRGTGTPRPHSLAYLACRLVWDDSAARGGDEGRFVLVARRGRPRRVARAFGLPAARVAAWAPGRAATPRRSAAGYRALLRRCWRGNRAGTRG